MGNLDLNLSRQSKIIRADSMSLLSFCIIGGGAIGSNVAYMLSAMGAGPESIHVYDYDTVSEANIAPARFRQGQVGQHKVFAMQEGIEEELGIGTIVPYPIAFDEDTMGEFDIVISCPDKMDVRRAVWENTLLEWKWLIDGRMGGDQTEIYVVGPGRDGPGRSMYDQVIGITDSSLECGEKATAPICKGIIPGMIGAAVANIANDIPPQASMLYSMNDRLIIWPNPE